METKFIEFQNVLNNFGGDLDLLRDTIALSLKYIPQHMEKVRGAVANQNAKDLEISAHTIKGSLSIYLYKPIVQTAFELEKIGRSGDFQSAQLMLGNLESQLTNFTHELQAFAANN